ncbi:hypothetical protein BO82DRAFT_150533 [Aspergillus uvarum CBS 121591]|uniref:Uncharacterized protein n=1 Tax=Aspergillus uvarum CBS 121591 TaxID=1448315 RepID=A0A319CJI7_9EURO|nr:hypothetical protein BO82DRAFT_150533 [Aspergillus uvarum CBS 121591]PYH78853.1 hypothetical protein BO82DRAFT_150533 [Aspergillus uvarum CBS 121591]
MMHSPAPPSSSWAISFPSGFSARARKLLAVSCAPHTPTGLPLLSLLQERESFQNQQKKNPGKVGSGLASSTKTGAMSDVGLSWSGRVIKTARLLQSQHLTLIPTVQPIVFFSPRLTDAGVLTALCSHAALLERGNGRCDSLPRGGVDHGSPPPRLSNPRHPTSNRANDRIEFHHPSLLATRETTSNMARQLLMPCA